MDMSCCLLLAASKFLERLNVIPLNQTSSESDEDNLRDELWGYPQQTIHMESINGWVVPCQIFKIKMTKKGLTKECERFSYG